MARGTTAGTTALVIVLALVFRATPKDAAFDLFNAWTSVFTGASLSLFLLATLCPKADSSTAAAGVLASLVVNVYLGLCSAEVLLPPAARITIDSYWTNCFVNLAFLAAAALWAVCAPALYRVGCCRKSARGGVRGYGVVAVEGEAGGRMSNAKP